MKIRYLILIFLLLACTKNAESTANIDDSVCRFDFDSQPVCVHGNMKVSVKTEKIETDEIRLISLEVERLGEIHSLAISEDTTLLGGDHGIIAFDDINFDQVPDISITTSFGVANLYLDYWIFNPESNKFSFIGNHGRFSIDAVNKTLSNTVKINAATYKKNVFIWKDFKLVKVEK